MKQKERLLKHFEHFGSVEPMQAWTQLGIYRLASRVCELRKDGYPIEKRMVLMRNRWGEEVRFARYTMEMVND
jgi:hypothetical protein